MEGLMIGCCVFGGKNMARYTALTLATRLLIQCAVLHRDKAGISHRDATPEEPQLAGIVIGGDPILPGQRRQYLYVCPGNERVSFGIEIHNLESRK